MVNSIKPLETLVKHIAPLAKHIDPRRNLENLQNISKDNTNPLSFKNYLISLLKGSAYIGLTSSLRGGAIGAGVAYFTGEDIYKFYLIGTVADMFLAYGKDFYKGLTYNSSSNIDNSNNVEPYQ